MQKKARLPRYVNENGTFNPAMILFHVKDKKLHKRAKLEEL